MKRRLIYFLFAALMLVPCVSQAAEPLRVFIRAGVKTHGPGQHDHPQFLKDWIPLLRDRGMQVDGSLQFPSAEQLNNTDVMVIYAANGMNITGEERTRFEDFLRRGGGIVVIHDAVVSADQHDWAKKVQGGSWRWQGDPKTKWYEGEVGLYFVDTNHPISRGISNFDWKDEIYYDMDMAPDVRVLATSFHSVFVIAPQLWTYEKTWEGGTQPYRAFVSLPGHEYETFNTPHYRAILLRGIAWAGKSENVDEFCRPEELASLKYPPGGPTHPDKADEKLSVHPDFNLQLVASEPLVEKVMSIDWDPQGRLWVAETPEYPGGRTINPNDAPVVPYRKRDADKFSGRAEDRPPKDRISWLEDSDGDGRMDKKQVFYEGLERVTSLVFHKDGVIVAQAPDVLWLRDTNADGKADKVETLYTGFGIGDSHAVINNFRWGMDGWIYSAIGYSAGNPRSGTNGKEFGRVTAGVIRFKPDGSALEQYASGSCNTWGFDFAPDGEHFYTTATCGEHFLHIVMPEKALARGSVGGVRASAVLPDHQKVFPAVKHTRPAYVQIDWVGMFTAASGSCIYNGGAWPEKYNNAHFLSEPTVSLVHRDMIEPKGATYIAKKEPGFEETEFIVGTDLWFRPIHTRVGPDGALYVVDFYNQAAIHNDTRGPAHGAHNAATRPDRDHHFARIWRVQHKNANPLPRWKFNPNDTAGLVKLLEHPNGWVRDTATRLLREHEAANPADALAKTAESGATSFSKIHALWTLHTRNQLPNSVLVAAINSGDSIVQKNALRAVSERERNADRDTLQAVRARLSSSDARVQLQALLALATFDPSEETTAAILNLWPQLQDSWIQSAALGVAAKDPLRYVRAIIAADRGAAHESFLRHAVRLLALKGDAEQAAELVLLLGESPSNADAHKQVALETLAANLRADIAPEWTGGIQTAFRNLLQSKTAAVRAAALPLIGRWDKQGALRNDLKPMIDELNSKLADATLSDDARGQVAINLLGVRHMDPAIVPTVAALIHPSTPVPLQRQLIDALGTTGDPKAGDELIAAFNRVHGDLREPVFAQLIKRAEWTRALVKALSDKRIPVNTLGPAFVHRLRTHPDRSVATAAAETIDALRGPEAKEKEALIAKLRPEVEKPGNIANGRRLYTENCANCHVFKDEGRNLAPNLTGMGAHGPHDLLVHIVDPNRIVEPNFISYSIETKSGESYDGIIERENSRELVLRNASGDYTIQQSDIQSRRSTGRSVMPEGLDALGAEALRDLIAYICSEDDQFRIVDVRGVVTADSTQGIYASKQSVRESVHFKQFGIVKANDVPFEILHPSRSLNGNNLIVLRGRNGMARSYPRAVEVDDLNINASRLHFLGGIGGWAWPFGGEERRGMPVATITVSHANGSSQSMTLTNGIHLADYIGTADVPGSKAAPGLVQYGQVRTFSMDLANRSPVTKIKIESANTIVAPTFVAITAELAGAASKPIAAHGSTAAAAQQSDVAKQFSPNDRTLGVVIVGGGASHDYPRWWGQTDVETLNSIPGVQAIYTEEPNDLLDAYDSVEVIYLSHNKPTPNPNVRSGLFDFVDRGGGLLILHAAGWINWRDWPEYNQKLVSGGSRSHDRLGEFEVTVTDPSHPLMKGVPARFTIVDELYHFVPAPNGPERQVLATGKSPADGRVFPVVWVTKHDKARIVNVTLGHDGRAHQHPAYKALLKNSILWTAREESKRAATR